MVKALRIALQAGQSYDEVQVYTFEELRQLGVPLVFGPSTVCFSKEERWFLSHNQNVNIVHISRDTAALPDSWPYERIVTANDAVYGPGWFIPGELHPGVPRLFGDSAEQMIFTDPHGLFAIPDLSVTTLECAHICPKPARPYRGVNLDR